MPIHNFLGAYDKCYFCKNACKKAPGMAPGLCECAYNPFDWSYRFAVYESSMMRMTPEEIGHFIVACRRNHIEPIEIVQTFMEMLYDIHSDNWNELVLKALELVQRREARWAELTNKHPQGINKSLRAGGLV